MNWLKKLLHVGSINLTFAERSLAMTEAYTTYMFHAAKIEEGIAAQKADIEAAHLRIAALNKPA